MPKEKIRVMSPYIGGGFGAKLFLRSDAVLAALGARAARRPVKVSLQRALIPNNTMHRAATIQRIRIGAAKDGKITAIAHETWSGDLPGGKPEAAAMQTRALYAGAHRMTANRLAVLDLPEANAMRAPGEAPGLAALEIAMDEMAEKLGMDPIEFRIVNDTQVVPDYPGKPLSADPQSKAPQEKPNPHPPFSKRQLVECLRVGAKRFGWEKRNPQPGQVRDGRWLVGMGVAAAFRDNLLTKSAARVRLDRRGVVTVETDMTDIGTGSYTIIAQTAAEMMGVPLEKVVVRLGDSSFPVSCGSGGQWGGNNSTAGVYAACMKLREAVAQKAGFNAGDAVFADGQVRSGSRSLPLAEVAGERGLVAEDLIEYGDLDKHFQQSTFGAHFVEVGVDAATGETRVRRMLAVCAAGRILNPKTARSQVIGAMTMGVGAALMEELAVDTAPRLLREPRSGRLRSAGACRHPAPGGDLPGRDRSDVVADEGEGRGGARHLRRRGRRRERDLQRDRRAGARLSDHARQAAGSLAAGGMTVQVHANFKGVVMYSTDQQVLDAVGRWAKAGHRFALVTVARTWGSAPRPAGSWMALRDDGQIQGSVSGGCIEADLIKRVLHGGFESTAPFLLKYGVTQDEAHSYGLPCGGTMELAIEPCSDLAALENLRERTNCGQLPRRRASIGQAGALITAGSANDALIWDGCTLTTLDGPAWRLLIVGAGQISIYLAQMAQALDYQAYICDPRSEYFEEWAVPGRARHSLTSMLDDAVIELNLDPHSAVVALTHDPKLDDLVLLDALKSPAFYVGALGSTVNNQRRRARLLQHLSPSEVNRLHGPVGLPIGSRTPPEIAVAILAEMTAVRNGVWTKDGLLLKRKPVEAGCVVA